MRYSNQFGMKAQREKRTPKKLQSMRKEAVLPDLDWSKIELTPEEEMMKNNQRKMSFEIDQSLNF